MRLGWLFLLPACLACGPETLVGVGNPGGVYEPGQGCTLTEASADCAGITAAGAGPQLRFEARGDTGMMVSTPTTLAGVEVTCRRSYCGTGALAAQAAFQWDDAITDDPRRMGTFVHTFDPPLDLLGHTVAFAVSVEGAQVPMHAQVGVVSDYWHWVAWAPVPVSSGWTRVAGMVSPDNPLTKLAAGATSVPVRSINIDVYVPVAPASGVTGSWSGAIYLDEAGW